MDVGFFNKTRVQNLCTPKNEIPSSMRLFYINSQLFIGFDFGFAELFDGSQRYLVKIASNFVALIITGIFLANAAKYYTDINAWLFLFQYMFYVIVLKHCKYNVFNFLTDITEIYKVSEVEKIFLNVSVACFPLMFVFKLAFSQIKCVFEGVSFCVAFNAMSVYYFGFRFACFAVIVINMTHVVIKYYIRCCLKKLRDRLKSDGNVNEILKQYMYVASRNDKIKPLYDVLLILVLLFDIPKMMTFLWEMLYNVKMGEKWYSYMLQLILVTYRVLSVFVPAVAAEMVNSEVHTLQLTIDDQLIREKNAIRRSELHLMFLYVKTRNLRHAVCRCVPADLALVRCLIGFCTTYFIIIVQFTHLYD